MTNAPSEDEDTADLSEVYNVLRTDAKKITEDLIAGVRLWRLTETLLLGIALLSLLLSTVTAYPSIMPATGILHIWEIVATAGLGVFSVGAYVWAKRTHSKLWTRYHALALASKKLR